MQRTQILIILLLYVGLHRIAANTNSRKCCKDLGCFDLGPPWSSLLRPLPPPQCPDECPVKFIIFTRPNYPENYTVSGWPIASFNTTVFDINRTTVLYTPGYTAKWDGDSNNLMKAYLKRADVNFIFLDWTSCSNENMLQAFSTIRTIAAQAVRFINYLAENHGLSKCHKLHVIGSSLGVHLASYVAKGLKDKKTGDPCVARLIGLESIGPLFEDYGDEVRIAITDAKFVEVVHTTTAPGVLQPRGHVDHYFNGNVLQPGCYKRTKNVVSKSLKQGNFTPTMFVNRYLSCGHRIVIKYYTEAIKNDNCTFWGEKINIPVQLINKLTGGFLAKYTTNLKKCTITSCSPFGLNAIEYPARGSFFVATNVNEPFCISRPKIDTMMAEKLQKYQKN